MAIRVGGVERGVRVGPGSPGCVGIICNLKCGISGVWVRRVRRNFVHVFELPSNNFVQLRQGQDTY